ncbi:prepilin-type N-terminal cleavage/methylation domain-containing protein [Thermodesulfobacteriota bacterium]
MDMKQIKRKNDSQGFTLIEVLIAISIFAIGFLAVAAMQITANKSTRRAVEITEATAIASDRMERLMALPYTDSLLDPGNHPPEKQGNYNIQWQVAFSEAIITGTTTIDAKTINLSVSWDRVLSGGSSQRSVDIDFIKPNPIYN